MGEAIISRRGGKQNPPASYTFLQLITSSLTWTVPRDGWYKIWCVGKSGNGGAGGFGGTSDTGHRSGGAGGSGGNSGGVAVSRLYLRGGATVAATVNASTSAFGGYLYATAGANGTPGADGVHETGGVTSYPGNVVGQGYGGNLINTAGAVGGYGGRGGSQRGEIVPQNGQASGGNSGGVTTAMWYLGGGGGAGADYVGLGIYQGGMNLSGGNSPAVAIGPGSPGTGASPVHTTPPRFEGGGGGGGGNTWYSAAIRPAGGQGSPGGIVIEQGA